MSLPLILKWILIFTRQWKQVGKLFLSLPRCSSYYARFVWFKCVFFCFLATIQIIIGSLTAAFSILVLILPKEQGSSAAIILSFSGIIGIAVGPIMCCGGYAGLSSYKDSQSRSKNGCHMACSILACLASGVGIGFFSAAVV